MMAKRFVQCLTVVGLLASALHVQAADDFNSSRSNRERGTLEAPAPDTGPCKPPYLCDTVAGTQATPAATMQGTPASPESGTASCEAADASCPVSPPVQATGKKGDRKGYVGHVTLMK